MESIVLELKNFGYGTKVTDVARVLGRMMNLHGKKWNSLYAIFAKPSLHVRSVTIYVKLRNVKYFHLIQSTPGVVTEGKGRIAFKFNNRKIRGTLLHHSEYREEIIDLSETCKEFHFVAALPRGSLDLKDLLIRLERYYSHGLDMIYSVSISKNKFYVAFKREFALRNFLELDYNRRDVVRSDSMFCVKRGILMRSDLISIVRLNW